MPAKKPLKKKVTPKKGQANHNNLYIIIGVLLIVIGTVALVKPWQYLPQGVIPFLSKPIAVTKPVMDMGRARQMTIDPQKDNVMQIVTQEKVRITLEVPKGAIKEKTLVKLIPFYHDTKQEAPTAGVVVGPASVNFSKPVTLSYNFSESTFKNDAPKTVISQLRMTGNSQVMQIDSDATSLTPTLIARGLETDRYLPARILTGGAYVFSLDGKNQVAIARKALSAEHMHTLTVMESATVLLFNNEKLSDAEMKKAKAAVVKILSQKEPPVFEYYAALVLKKKITTPTFSLIPVAFAYSTDEGFFQLVCKDDIYSVEEYIGFAKSAQLMGHDAAGQSCIDKAKNKVAEETKKVLAGDPDLKTVMITLKDVQFLGLDDDTNLDEQLLEKAKEVATEDAKKVADDPNSSVIDAAKEMQKMQAVGADEGPTYEALEKKVTDAINQKEADAEKAGEDYEKTEAERQAEYERLTKELEEEEKKMEEEFSQNTIDDEEILQSQLMSVLGIGLLQAFGFDELDKESVQAKFDKMQEDTKALVEAGYVLCVEMRAEGVDAGNCEGMRAEQEASLKEAEEMGYRTTNEMGDIQSRDFEEPEYLEENGDVDMYFEMELTPTPGGDEGMVDETIEDSNEPYYEEQDYNQEENYDQSSYDQQEESYNEEQSNVDYGGNPVSEEEVQGASTKRSPWFNWGPFR